MRVVLAAWLLSSTIGTAVVPGAQAPTVPSTPETGTAFYARYLAAVRTATSVDQVLAFWSRAVADEFRAAPPDQRVDLDGMKRIYAMTTNIRVAKETPSAAGATLALEGTSRDGKPLTGAVYLVKEDGAWKVLGPEHWDQ